MKQIITQKKGFTIIELLVVVAIIGVLVTIALPGYKITLEKGRALEGIANVAAVSEAVNTYYLKNYNSYGTINGLRSFAVGDYGETDYTNYNGIAGRTASKYFSVPAISLNEGAVTVQTDRQGLSAENTYSIAFVNEGGETTERYCTGNQVYCKTIGATIVRQSGGWKFDED